MGQMVRFTENNETIWLYTAALDVSGEIWPSAGYADQDEAEQGLAAVVAAHARDYVELHPPAPGESNAPAASESGSRIIHCQYQRHTLSVLCELIRDRVIRLTIAPYHFWRLPNTAYSLVEFDPEPPAGTSPSIPPAAFGITWNTKNFPPGQRWTRQYKPPRWPSAPPSPSSYKT